MLSEPVVVHLGGDLVLETQPVSNEDLLDMVLFSERVVTHTSQSLPGLAIHLLLLIKHFESLVTGKFSLRIGLACSLLCVVEKPLLAPLFNLSSGHRILLLV